MEENTNEVVIPERLMNPSTNAPIYYGPSNLGSDGALLAGLANRDMYAPALDGATNSALGCARDQIGDLKGIVKDVGSNVRSDIGDVKMLVKDASATELKALGDAECRLAHKIGDFESRTMVKLGDVECKVIKENADQTLYLTNQLSVIREQGIRNEYETKLSREQTIKEVNAKIDYKYDRLNDQIHHVEDKLQHCCCEGELADANIQNGLVNIQNILNAITGGAGLK